MTNMSPESTLPESAGPPSRRITRRWTIPASVCSFALVIVFLGFWEFYVHAFNVSSFILPAPSDAVAAWIQSLMVWRTWHHTWITVYETAAGFACAIVIGVGLGALIGRSPFLERVLNPFVVATQVIPKVALVPLFIVWFGFGPTSKVITAAVLSFFPILTNTVLGIKSVSISHREVMDTLNASRWHKFMQLEFHSALPYILTGMEIGIVLAMIGAVVGEYLGGNEGLGNLAVKEMNSFNTTALFAVIIQLSILGLSFYAAIKACRKLAVPWHESVLINKRR